MFRNWKKIREENQAKWWGAIFGLFIFLGSIMILWNNEGRINFGELANKSIPVSANTNSTPNNADELIALNGDLFSKNLIGDPFFLPPEKYIQINRNVEMYAWNEKESSEEGSDEKDYSYDSNWTTSPSDSSQFADTSFENPYLPFDSAIFTVDQASVGNYSFNPNTMKYPTGEKLTFEEFHPFNNSPDQSPMSAINGYLYLGFSNISSPDIGDLRISFTAVPHQKNITAFGKLEGEKLLPFDTEREAFYRILFLDRESSIEFLRDEYKSQLWGSRFAGAFAMWCGLFLLLNPMTILVSFIPFISNASKWVMGLIALIITFILASITISVSYFAHNPLILILLLLGVIILFLGFNKYAEKNELID